jgi:hypothetical protein
MVLLTAATGGGLPEGRTSVSAPLPFRQLPRLTGVSLLAAVMALTSVQVLPMLMVAAIAGA